MRRWWLEAITFVVTFAAGVGVLTALGQPPADWFDDGASDSATEESSSPNSSPQDASDRPPSSSANSESTTMTGSTSDAIEGDAAIELCVEHTMAFAFLGDDGAADLWNFAGESEDELAAVCAALVDDQPEVVEVWLDDLSALREDSNPAGGS